MGPWRWLKRILPIGPTFQLQKDDLVVFVVGPTGSGKSMFVRAATQTPGLVEVGPGLRATTRKVHAIRCELTDEARKALGAEERRNIVFVDTPSFHIDPEENSRAEKETSTWLKKSRCKSTRVGIIYMHRIEIDPTVEKEHSMQHHLDTFAGTFPSDFASRAFPKRLHCVFSYVDGIKQAKIADHRVKFQGQLSSLRPKIVHGMRVKWNVSTHPDLFVKGDPDTAWNAVERLFSPLSP